MHSPASAPPNFQIAPLRSGDLFDLRSDQHPTMVSAWCNSRLLLGTDATHFGFVQRGPASLTTPWGTFPLQTGMYFAVPAGIEVSGMGSGWITSLAGYRGFFHVGGPIEHRGRLTYIDGCTDSLLISPVTLGDPCLNLLHIPAATDQTPHTHPSLRVGLIVSGKGTCQTDGHDVSLVSGQVFVIQANGLHSFHTADHSLTIVAWHPDSDFGPSDHQHPMLNRTLVEGRPVNEKRVDA